MSIFPLWIASDKRFRSRQYHEWDRFCHVCQRKLVVGEAIKRQLEGGVGIVLDCQECALAGSSKVEELLPAEAKTRLDEKECPICAASREQEEVAMVELARARDLPKSVAIKRKLAHLSNGQWGHRFKVHNEARGKT